MLKKMHEKFNCTLGVGPYQGFSRGWVTDKGDEKYLSAVWEGDEKCCQKSFGEYEKLLKIAFNERASLNNICSSSIRLK